MATPTAEVLGKVPMFSALTARQLRKLAQSSSEDHYDAGVTIVREGGRSDNFFVVVEGSASVVHDGQEVSRRGPGEFFGEISMLDGRPRAASVIAETPMTCIVVYRDALRSLVMNDPKVAWELLLSFAARMRGE